MKAEAQRIAIAEACGWTATQLPTRTYPRTIYTSPDRKRYCTVWKKGGFGGDALPDYLSDLNAMHEAIASQKFWAAKWSEYVEHLISVVTRSNPDWMCRGSAENCIEATAAQRAEAFLRTLSLWDDTK